VSGREPLLAVEDLEVHFPTKRGGRVVRAVDGVSFEVSAGETFGLIGESGSGKSTVARAVMQLVAPTEGRVRFRGRDLAALSRRDRRLARRRLQMVFQDSTSALDPRQTVIRSLREPLELQGLVSDGELARVDELIARVGLNAAHRDRYPHELSGGQRQRVNIARALVLRPELLVCDEAVSALDVSVRAEVLNLLIALRDEMGLACLFIGHDLGVVGYVSVRVGVMYLGHLMELGTTSQVLEQPVHPYTLALRSAEPEVVPPGAQRRRRIPLQGEIPSPADPPSGCVFHTRCPFAVERCRDEVPAWREVSEGRFVACHLVEADGALRSPGWSLDGGGIQV
jgi:oligopeptide/dipeptide ABC transporter ATP-binding protein